MELRSITFPGLPEPYSVAPASGFVAKNKVSTVEALDAWIDELVAAQEVATEKTYYCTLNYSSGLSLPYGRWSITIHKPDVGTDQALVGVTATVLTSGIIHRLRKEMYKAEWLPWEWETPPMALGVSYRTTERYLGKPVYTRVVNCGEAANEKNVSISTDGSISVIRYAGECAGRSLPYIEKTMDSAMSVWVYVSKYSVYICCGASQVGNKIYVRIWYTKDNE